MTLSSATTSVTATGNSSTTVWPFSFLIPYQADGVTPAVSVFTTSSVGVQTTLVLGTDFSITGVGNPAGGSVTYPLVGSPLASPNLITIERALAYLQPDAYTNTGFLPSTVETGLDNAVMEIQQLAEDVADIDPTPTVVASLPSAQASAGFRRTVTDSTVAMASNFGSIVAGSGSNTVPVFCDGQHWRIG